MNHDPFCPQPLRHLSRPGLTVINGPCDCALIAKVRQDERDTAYEQGVRSGYFARLTDVDDLVREARTDMLDRCIAAVEHLHDHEAPHDAHREALWNAISALRALKEQP